MARQYLGDKKVKRFERLLKKPIDYIQVRGGTNHRYDIYYKDGTEENIWKEDIKNIERKGGIDWTFLPN